jgi:hypothetical protein
MHFQQRVPVGAARRAVCAPRRGQGTGAAGVGALGSASFSWQNKGGGG